MRKIGIETSAYFQLSGAWEGFEKMKRHGFACADYQNLVNTENALFSASEGEFERTLTEHRKAAEQAGVEIYQVHGPWRYPPRDAAENERAERFEKMKKTLWGTSLLHSRHFVIHPVMPFGPDEEPDSALFYKINHDFFSALLDEALKYDVVICLENMPFSAHSIARPAEILQFIRSFDDSHMAMCLDTGHSAVLGVPPAEALREGADLIKTLHVHDNDGRSDFHRAPYDGVIDWAAFSEALSLLPAEVPLSLETQAPAKMPSELHDYFQIGLAKIGETLCGRKSNSAAV